MPGHGGTLHIAPQLQLGSIIYIAGVGAQLIQKAYLIKIRLCEVIESSKDDWCQ